MNEFVHTLESAGPLAPWLFLLLFLVAQALMIWRLEAMTHSGVEGTVLGTLVMPYCSGMGNLVFAFLIGRDGGPGGEVITNCLVNNVTNLTLLVGVPALIWGMTILPGAGEAKGKKAKKPQGDFEPRLNRLSLLLTLTAACFFTGVVWALARDGRLDFGDGLVLVGLFLFWQCVHVFEVLKANVRQNRTMSWMLPVNLALLAVGAFGIYISVDWLVKWLGTAKLGFINADNMGWLSGWLMVLPNGVLALYYGWRNRADIVYSSQVGDGHICIPLCIGIVALFQPVKVDGFFETGMQMILGAVAVHFLFVALFGRLPRFMGLAFAGAYGYFIYKGLIG